MLYFPQFEANGQEQPEEEQPQQPTIDNNAALRHGKHQKYQQRGVRGHCASESEEECSEYNRHLASLFSYSQITLLALQVVQLASNWNSLVSSATVCITAHFIISLFCVVKTENTYDT